MLLCLDIGNFQIFGGVFDKSIKLRFRYDSRFNSTSDQLGLFLKNVLQENNISSSQIKHIAICSVVPQIDYSLRSACRKYFDLDPFVLQAGVKTGLKIKYQNPLEVGADRIANAIAAIQHYPNRDIIIVDFGTATTICAISARKEYLGGIIFPGIRLSVESLQNNTAKLSAVEIIKPETIIGRSIIESIQSGIYRGQLGAIREIIQGLKQELFSEHSPIIIGTGGFAYLFENEKIFTVVMPDLVLEGLYLTWQMNISITSNRTKNFA